MIVKAHRTNRFIFRCAFVGLSALGASAPVFAQAPVRVTIPGTAFSVATGGKAAVDDVAGGRRFRGTPFGSVTLRGLVQLPSASLADPKLQRLVVHFRTSHLGPSLLAVEVRNGGGTGAAFRAETRLSGDYTAREATEPKAVANAWVIQPTTVGAQSTVRLDVNFPGGFEGGVSPGEIVLTSVELEFPHKPFKVSDTVLDPSRSVAHAQARAQGTDPSSPKAVPAPLVPSPNGVIYVRTSNDDLMWYRHDGRADGTFRWALPDGRTVGTGWAFSRLISGGDGIIYAITAGGDLLWYRHDGRTDGTFRWAATDGKKIASGWDYKQVFAGGDGTLYAINARHELLWYRHDGYADGTPRWAVGSGKRIASGWEFEQVFSGNGGVIYAINARHELLWYRHDGRADGMSRWAPGSGNKVASDWSFKQVFSDGSGVIYGVTATNDLVWYRHDGRADGTVRWAAPSGKKVGNGWSVKEIFSGGMPGL